MANLFGQVAQAPCALPVVGDGGRFLGAISKTTLLKFLDRDTPAVPPSSADQPAATTARNPP